MSLRQQKLAVAAAVTILAGFIFWQNRETIDVQVLMFKVSTSRAAALSLSFLIGVLVGFLAFSRWTAKNRTKTE
jgi:hypothetical protein